MIEMKVKIEGLDELKKLLNRAPQLTAREASRAVEKAVMTVESHAKREAPVNKSYGGGNLRQKIRGRMRTPLQGEVIASAPYAGYVEEGTRPHIIVPVRKRVLANKRTGQVFGKLVHHPGTRPNPFMQRAIDKSKGSIAGFFDAAIQNIVKALS